jgi:hypothetical protein
VAQTLKLRAYGRTVELVGPKEVVDLAVQLLPSSYRLTSGPAERRWTVQSGHGGQWSTLVDGTALAMHLDPDSATETALSDLELWVAEHARRAVFVHAGCVVAGGMAILIPGYSWSGKTSLTAALVRAGAIYYSDEYAVIDHRGLVRPYPRPLSTRRGTGIQPERVTVAQLGGRAGRGPAHVGLIATLRYAAAGWNATTVTRAGAGMHLLQNTVPAKSRPRACLHAIQQATSGARAVAGTRGEADEAAAILLDMLAG